VIGPSWLAAGFAALMLLIAACGAGRVTIGRLCRRATEPDAGAPVECAAMIYMLLPAGHGPGAAMPGMGGPGSAGNPAIALVLALFMLGYVLWTTDHLPVLSRARSAASGAVLAPRLAACYKIAMSVGMGYMLITML
jgi:hypothetical protein